MAYEAITASGATYYIDRENGWWEHRETGREKLGVFMQNHVPRNELELPWNNRDHWYNADVPEVGKLLYLASMGYWRISTEVVEVKEVEARY